MEGFSDTELVQFRGLILDRLAALVAAAELGRDAADVVTLDQFSNPST